MTNLWFDDNEIEEYGDLTAKPMQTIDLQSHGFTIEIEQTDNTLMLHISKTTQTQTEKD